MALSAQGAAAGASAGAAVGGPWGAAIGGIAGAFMGGGGAGTAQSSPAYADQTALNSIDFSGWTVATHGATADGAETGTSAPPWLMFAGLALAAVVAVRWIAKKS